MTAKTIAATHHPVSIHALAFATFVAAAIPAYTSIAQDAGGVATPEAIVGAEIETGSVAKTVMEPDVIEAIANVSEATEAVLMLYTASDFQIVYVGSTDEGDIGAALDRNADGVQALREAIDASSVFYVALDSKDIDADSVVAARVSDDKSVTVYVSGEER